MGNGRGKSMASRKIEDCLPALQEKFLSFDSRMRTAGIDYIVTCTYRPQYEQDALYAQGRTAPGRIVTWTKRSKHTLGRAFDIVILENGKPDWDAKNPKWKKAGEIGRSVGLKWGGDFSNPDMPHFEIG